ncbi:hypothetical protein C4B63_19g27 [Trypanosoma cruzi]|uniref:Uncharacterized protein n=1 Tax=Trypanosoma cruzi TaxID=5693 RepID=A0A2V2VKH4_TRYCR|nr:hypothetical protein C4B63_19g27 [Trypanosoma cruzi]
MKHLDAVLGDMFGIEHQYHSRVALEILQKHRLGGIQSYNRNNGSQLQPVPRYRSESLYPTKAQTLSEDSATTTPMVTPSSVAPKPTKGGDNGVGDLSFAAASGLAGVALGAAATPLFSKGTSVIETEDVNEDSVELREVGEEVDIQYDSTHSPATPAARFVDHDEKHDDEEEDFNEDKAGELKEFEKEGPEKGVPKKMGSMGKAMSMMMRMRVKVMMMITTMKTIKMTMMTKTMTMMKTMMMMMMKTTMMTMMMKTMMMMMMMKTTMVMMMKTTMVMMMKTTMMMMMKTTTTMMMMKTMMITTTMMMTMMKTMTMMITMMITMMMMMMMMINRMRKTIMMGLTIDEDDKVGEVESAHQAPQQQSLRSR